MLMKHRLLASAALSLALVAAPSMAASGVSVNEAGGVLHFTTAKAHGDATLVVIGPNGYSQTRTFQNGEAVSLSLLDGVDLVDGNYKWSLRMTSPMSDELRAQIAEARAAGDDGFTARLAKTGDFYAESFSGSFTRAGGVFVVPNLDAPVTSTTDVPTKAQVFADDLIVDGSFCVGISCNTTESFGFDTILMKENNLRIKFDDSSSTGTFPNVDWELIANDSSNGGANYFRIQDDTNNKSVFTVEANGPNNALYVASEGKVGVKTGTPQLELHAVGGNSPGLRLEQDGSAGFQSQVWDLSGNETNFFIRDVTNGSKLPLRIFPGTDNDNALVIGANGHIGIGQASSVKNPDAVLDIDSSDTGQNMLVRFTGAGNRTQLELENTAANAAAGQTWRYDVNGAGIYSIIDANNSVTALQIAPSTGDITIAGSLTSNLGGTFPDYVFEDDYDLMPLDELAAYIEAEGHLPKIEKADSVEARGTVDMTKLQLQLLEKIEELTLYTLSQQKTIEQNQELIQELRDELAGE